jgi:hypothetical protein
MKDERSYLALSVKNKGVDRHKTSHYFDDSHEMHLVKAFIISYQATQQDKHREMREYEKEIERVGE